MNSDDDDGADVDAGSCDRLIKEQNFISWWQKFQRGKIKIGMQTDTRLSQKGL